MCGDNPRNIGRPPVGQVNSKYKEDLDMGPAQPDPSIPSRCAFKAGDRVVSGGKEFKVEVLGLKYYNSNGNRDTMYAQISGDSGNYLITYFALNREFKLYKPEPKLVSLRELMRANPCPDGKRFIAHVLGIDKGSSDFEIGLRIQFLANSTWDAQFLSEKYRDCFRNEVPTSWLEFVANVLQLIPTGVKANRATLILLLGLEE